MNYFRLWILHIIHLLEWWSLVKSDDILSLFRSEHRNFCITNSSSAMYFATGSGINHEGSTILPRSNYFCDFERSKENKCLSDFKHNRGGWKVVNSLTHENSPLFDLRWEGLPVVELRVAEKNKPNRLYFKKMLDIEYAENFRITVSIRATELHFLFCDEMEVSEASCYWFILQGWRGTKTVFRKCIKQIPVEDGRYPDHPCKDRLEEIWHPKDYPNFLEMENWTHVTLEKQGNTFSLYNIKNNQSETILQYTDNEKVFNIRYMIGHTKDKVAYYKIHMNDYLRTTYISDPNFELVNTFRMKKVRGKICLSILLTTCADCWTEVEAFLNIGGTSGPSDHLVFGRKQLPPSHGVWTEHKIQFSKIVKDKERFYFYISIKTKINSSNPSSETFWSIDNYRQCSEEEYRISPENILTKSCHLLSPEQKITWLNVDSLIPESRCQSWDRFGESCVPCDFLRENEVVTSCQKMKVCEVLPQSKRCFCSPGYIGPECDKACEAGAYGHVCSEKCGNCFEDSSCRVEDGYCPCNNLFEGATCKEPKSDIILKKEPRLINTFSTSCIVQLVDKEYLGKSEPRYYLVQYRKSTAPKTSYIASGGDSWEDGALPREIDDDGPIILENLESSTTYQMRILIANDESNLKNLQEAKVPYTVCKTTCDAWNDTDITLILGSRNVTLDTELAESKCKTNSYNWTLYRQDDAVIKSGIMKKKFSIGPLAIFTEYKLIFSGSRNSINIVRKFRTMESVPSEVHEVTHGKPHVDSIELKWKEPREPNGIIQYYRIEYRKVRGYYCSEEKWEETKERNVSTATVELTGLTAFSVYLITIFANNQKYESKSVSHEAETSGLDTFSEDEGFAHVELNITAIYERAAILSVDNLRCQYLQGTLQIKYKCQCLSVWCKRLPQQIGEIDPLKRVVSVKELQPFTKYSVVISFCRKSFCKLVLQKDFSTQAAYPNYIRQLLVTSKGDNYINLRWLAPYPPTGTLSAYKITTTCTTCKWLSYNKQETNFKPTQCTIWSDFECAQLTANIFADHSFSVQIQAANEENAKFVNVENEFVVKTGEEPSEPPYGLDTIWHENNVLVIIWKHPNVTNGNLKLFTIELKITRNRSSFYEYKVNEKTYQLTYQFQIKDSLPPSSDITIRITAQNSFSSQPATKTDSSFPVIPEFENPRISVTNSTESTISIFLDVAIKDKKKKNAYYLFILTNDLATKMKDDNVLKLEEILNETIVQETYLRMAAEVNLNDLTGTDLNFIIGENRENKLSAFLNSNITNSPLQKAQYYNITILIVSEYKKKYRIRFYSVRSFTLGNPEMTTQTALPEPKNGENEESAQGSDALYALLLLLLLVPFIIGAIIYRKKIFQRRPTASVEKIMDSSFRNQAHSKSNNEVLVLASKEPSPLLTRSVMKMRPKVSRKSTNPPNPANEIHSMPVRVANFEEYVKAAIQSGELERQHALFPRGPTQPWKYGSMKVNKSKNRYNNLVAYDHSRVKLEKLPGDEHSDYINASYIDGYNVPRAYIATQGPKSSTLVDFWRMVWQENVKHIVMLANIYENGKKKVEQYWPNINQELNFENISVQYVSVDTFADFEYKIFHVIRGNEIRKLEQLHFTSWPDHGVPLYPQSLVPFLRKILKISHSPTSPIVVHCSAGVGRTGTILLADICLRMAAKEGVVDMVNHLQKLREQRSNMVDNVEQYKLAHLIVLESLMGLHTSIPCNNIDEAITKLLNEEEYKIQIDYLKETEWQDQAMVTPEEGDEEYVIYPEKNRFQDIVPNNRSRIFLTRYPSDDSSSSYINAVQVDGFRCPGRFIVTQQPMPNTLNDFWRLVAERQISVIVSLNPINLNDQTCCCFFPTSDDPEIHPVDFITVKFGKHISLEHYDIFSVRVWVTRSEEKFDVEIISFKGWTPKSWLPSSCEEFLSFWEEADTISRRSKTVLVTCYDGQTASGVYVTLCFVIEKIKLEQECDVCLAVRNVRHNRKQFVAEESQFVFLYEAALRYINGFQSYANFQNQ